MPTAMTLSDEPTHRLRGLLSDCADGRLAPNVALMHMIIAASSVAEVEAALAWGARAWASEAGGNRSERTQAVVALWRANPQAFETVKTVISEADHGGAAQTPPPGAGHWSRAFDRMARVAPEAAVALYALGNADLLESATDEAVALLRSWRLLGPDRTVLDLGCGIGRFAAALSPEASHVVGLDVSPEMIARARARCLGLPNVSLAVSNGCDLGAVEDESLDLVLAADVFPYLVLAGSALVERHLDETARVLRPGGALVVFNYSYRGDPNRDRTELTALGAARRLLIEEAAAGLLSLWDAVIYRLRKRTA
jgi:SAM-dependent methyltransferase